jgi:hypothetical protein
MSRAVIPAVPESIFAQVRESIPIQSHITFTVSPGIVVAPQTHHSWFIEMDHEMGSMRTYSLIPQKNNDNQYVAHYKVETSRPRFLGPVEFTDAWMTTHHQVIHVNDAEIHFSQSLFSPVKADDKLYFNRPPMHRVEVLVPNRFIEDRELWQILSPVFGKEYEIRSLVQRLP